MRPPSIAYPVLIADIGGTNCRVSLVEDAERPHRHLARIGTGSFATAEEAFDSVIATLPQRPRSAVLAVAGPMEGRIAQLTNASWHFDGPRIAGRLGLTQGLLVNDFEALAASLAVLKAHDVETLIEGEPEQGGVKLVLGPGTGFGAAALLTQGERGFLLPTECGHLGLGPEDPAEEKLWPILAAKEPRMTIETLLSGDGLVRLHKAVAASSGLDEPQISAADISRMALDGDPATLMTVVCFWRLLARVAGDLALAFKATGGVYIAGGIAPHLLPLADRAALRAVYVAKPPLEELMAKIPLHVVTAQDAAEQGLAAIAAQLSRFGLDDPRRLWFG
ncbi:glucokinase [Bosea sp. (in: a-proteobacteria)]|uniref:glucokinase n=1 Tax=Bosea sp. (in: a-proteobacteria) TaxID=1871050 RepID=UPI003B3A87C2